MLAVDIIIPAYNNAGTIRRVLGALWTQLAAGDSVIAVDDGSTDNTAAVVSDEARRRRTRLAIIRRPHEGPAAARNAGLAAAAGDVALFLGADTIPEQHLLARHRAVHRAYPEPDVGCLGLVTWDPALPPTPFMVWLARGVQNRFGALAGARWVDPGSACYGSNLSLKRRRLIDVGGFDAANFPGYGWEDAELGIRLSARGVRLLYEPAARAWHVHPQSLGEFLARQRVVGGGLLRLHQLHPRHVPPPRALRAGYRRSRAMLYPRPVRVLLLWAARNAERRWILPRLYATVSGLLFTEGVQRALADSQESCG